MSFPRTDFPKLPLVTALWTLFEEQGSVFYRLTDDPENLNWTRQLILSENPDLENYQPLLALIVTWHGFVLPTIYELVSDVLVPLTLLCKYTSQGRDDPRINLIGKISLEVTRLPTGDAHFRALFLSILLYLAVFSFNKLLVKVLTNQYTRRHWKPWFSY